jgi:putative transposase
MANDKLKIQLEVKDIDFTNTCNNVLGVDVNSKHNLFTLSDGTMIDYNRKLIKKLSKAKLKNDRIRSTKATRNIDTSLSKKQIQIQDKDKNKRRCKWHTEYKISELFKYCNSNNIDAIVLEELRSSKGKCNFKTKEDINYKDLFKLLKLYDIKNIAERMSNNYNITVNLTNAMYTSQQCNKCGYISKENRKKQEVFKCIQCNHEDNADINASKNIKDRITVNVLRNSLHDKITNNKYKPKTMKKEEFLETLNKVLNIS